MRPEVGIGSSRAVRFDGPGWRLFHTLLFMVGAAGLGYFLWMLVHGEARGPWPDTLSWVAMSFGSLFGGAAELYPRGSNAHGFRVAAAAAGVAGTLLLLTTFVSA